MWIMIQCFHDPGSRSQDPGSWSDDPGSRSRDPILRLIFSILRSHDPNYFSHFDDPDPRSHDPVFSPHDPTIRFQVKILKFVDRGIVDRDRGSPNEMWIMIRDRRTDKTQVLY